MLRVERKFKTYPKRRLYIYNDNKVIDALMPWWGWYTHTNPESKWSEYGDGIRKIAMENLYWLLGRDNDKEGWEELVELWDKGKHIAGPVYELPDSLFHSKEEKMIALNSFENK